MNSSSCYFERTCTPLSKQQHTFQQARHYSPFFPVKADIFFIPFIPGKKNGKNKKSHALWLRGISHWIYIPRMSRIRASNKKKTEKRETREKGGEKQELQKITRMKIPVNNNNRREKNSKKKDRERTGKAMHPFQMHSFQMHIFE